MCLKCILLGALVNAEVDPNDGTNEGRFRCESLSPFDYTPSSAEVRHMVDESAAVYLADTLGRFRSQYGIEFCVLSVESDGSCLPHAISRCLVGHEVYYDALRLDLQAELRDHAAWYQAVLNSTTDGTQVYDKEEWSKKEWPRILHAASPTYGQHAGEDRWLGPEHVLGFANLLGRPILLLNTPEIMSDPHHGLRGGMFLPLRRSRTDIMQQHNGNFPAPIVIGYANATGHHYVALVRTLSPLNMLKPFVQGPVRDLIDSHWNYEARSALLVALREPVRVPVPSDLVSVERVLLATHPVTGRRMLVLLPLKHPKAGGTITSEKIYPMWADLLGKGIVSLVINNGPAARARALKALQAYVRGLIRAQQDAIYGKYDQMSKVSTIPLDKSAGCRWIAGVRGAQDILEACGYVLDDAATDINRDGRGRCFRLRQGGPPVCGDAAATSGNDMAGRAMNATEEALRTCEGIIAYDPLTSLRYIEEMLKKLSGADAVSGEVSAGGFELPGGEWEPRLLGQLPRYSWLGVGPPSIIHAKTGKEQIPKWPSASSCSADNASQLLWDAARSHYGSGRVNLPDMVWEFGVGSDGGDFCERLNFELQARFLTLTRGVFGTFPEVMLKLQMQGLRYGTEADIIVVCPDCGTECVPDMPPHLLRSLDDELCIGHCPNASCRTRLNLKKTYRQSLADAVAEAAKGSLGGVWKCQAEATAASSFEIDLIDALEGGVDNHTPPTGTCDALNVGISSHCVSCGSKNPSVATPAPPKKQQKLDGGAAAADDVTESLWPAVVEDDTVDREAQMLQMMIGMLTDTYTLGKKRTIDETSEQSSNASSNTSVLSAASIGQGEEKRSKMITIEETQNVIFNFDYLVGMETDIDNNDKDAMGMSAQDAVASDIADQAMPEPTKISDRSVSCPAHVSFSVRPKPKKGTEKEETALRMVAVRSGDEGLRQTSEPITRREREHSKQVSGIDLKTLTRHNALRLFRNMAY